MIIGLSQLHDGQKEVSTKAIFSGTEATATSLQIKANGLLKEHITKVPAFLLCVDGAVIFENEQGVKFTLTAGQACQIEPFVKHWVRGVADSQLVLFK